MQRILVCARNDALFYRSNKKSNEESAIKCHNCTDSTDRTLEHVLWDCASQEQIVEREYAIECWREEHNITTPVNVSWNAQIDGEKICIGARGEISYQAWMKIKAHTDKKCNKIIVHLLNILGCNLLSMIKDHKFNAGANRRAKS